MILVKMSTKWAKSSCHNNNPPIKEENEGIENGKYAAKAGT